MSLTSNHIASDVEQFITIMNKANAEGFNKRVLLSDAPKGLLVFCGAVCEKTHIDRVIYRDTHKELDLSASTLNTLVDILPDDRGHPITIGQILPNGATVLDMSYKSTWYGGCRNKDYYVLCKLDDSELHPFATWWVDPARPESTSNGNYSQSFSYAMDDFITRCGHINERGLDFHREK